jgi:hypothetical protein
MKYNKNLAGVQITDELINRSSSASARLAHDTILANTVVVRTAPAGGGTLLALTTDYTLGSEDARLTTEAGGTVNTTIAIVNGAFLNTALYVTYKTVGDYAEAEDVGLEFVNFNIASANQSYTLPNPKSTNARGIRISWSGGTGAFKLTINGTINGYSLWEGIGNGAITVYSDGNSWYSSSDGAYDYGSFSNGNFEKHINGIMHQNGSSTQVTSGSSSNLFGSSSGTTFFNTVTRSFPVLFISAPRMATALVSPAAIGYITNATTVTSTGFLSIVGSGPDSSVSVTSNWIASGRWRV